MAGKRSFGRTLGAADKAALQRPDLAGELAAVAAVSLLKRWRRRIRNCSLYRPRRLDPVIRYQRANHAFRVHRTGANHSHVFRVRAWIDPGRAEAQDFTRCGHPDPKTTEP